MTINGGNSVFSEATPINQEAPSLVGINEVTPDVLIEESLRAENPATLKRHSEPGELTPPK